MRLINTEDTTMEGTTIYYAGICKNNTQPKHVTKDNVIVKNATIGKTKVTMYNSPKSHEYIYIQAGSQWLWVKDKTIMDGEKFEETKIERKAKVMEAQPEATPEG